MPPSPFGTAFCMAAPLHLSKLIVCLNDKESAQHNAEYSPKEWPAKYFALFKSKFVSFFIILNIEKLTKNIAGWVFSVFSNSELGPSKIILLSFFFKISSASEKYSFTYPKLL